MPDTKGKNVRLEPAELAMLLSGIDLNRPRLEKRQPPETAIDNRT